MDNEKRRMTFARALFDNVAEMPRELSFKKGDILTVLQEKYENNPEWWVCSLRNMVGLAPANRLEAMPVLMQNKPVFQSQMSASTYDELPERSAQDQSYLNIPKSGEVVAATDDTYSTYQLPKEDVYVNPVAGSEYSTNDENSIYQIPTDGIFDETYSNTIIEAPHKQTLNLPKDNTAKTALPSKESFASEYYNDRYDYSDSFSDATSTSFTESSVNSMNNTSLASSDSGDFRFTQKDSTAQLFLTENDAIVKYRQLQNETTLSCNRVIEFAKAKWKSEEVLKVTASGLQQCFLEFHNNLVVLINFAVGVYQNSLNCNDINLTKKLGKHVSPLQESRQTIKYCMEKLDSMNWEPEKIATSVRLAVKEGADALGQVVEAARNVLINIRSLSVTINGNASILFSATNNDESGLATVSQPISKERDEERSSVQDILKLFVQQVRSQVELVNETVDDFMAFVSNRSLQDSSYFKETVTNNSKFVVRTATQLVCIAKNLSDSQIKTVACEKIEEAGNRLCDSLKTMINVIKQLITDQRWTNDQKDQLLRHLKAVKSNANSLEIVVVRAVT